MYAALTKGADSHGQKLIDELGSLSNRISQRTHDNLPRIDFLRELSVMLTDFFKCDGLELRIREDDEQARWEMARYSAECFCFESLSWTNTRNINHDKKPRNSPGLEELHEDITHGSFDVALSCFTEKGSFWTGDTQRSLPCRPENNENPCPYDLTGEKDSRSIVVIPIIVGNETIGFLQLKSKHPHFFTEYEIRFYEGFVRTLGIALLNQRAQSSLRERIKELTCLYGIARTVESPDTPLEEALHHIVELLPPAWQYPEITHARITLDKHTYSTPGFRTGPHKQTANIVVGSKDRGSVEVVYSKKKAELDEGPFLAEERDLLDAVARELSVVIERRQTEEEKLRLREQLQHADRLATIGQLAAGVAHELNEPLGNILGFAQLAGKCQGLPEQAEKDVQSIEKASLHAREIVKKLMLFARQMPPKKTRVNLNQVVEESLYFLESRCAKEGIELVRLLATNIPKITADQAQLQQVLVNLIVNAIQSMPGGGQLTVQTLAHGKEHISMIVEDKGIGMSKKVMDQIFIPFFTTKDVGQGTGLGLPVVHGIVASHGGSIKVKSKAGHGSRFEIQLPVLEKAKRITK
jgi:signal transduction histidine kinase